MHPPNLPIPRPSLQLAVWTRFFIPQLKMPFPALLCRGSGIFLGLTKQGATRVLCSRHVLLPMDYPWYAPPEAASWMRHIKYKHVSFQISLHDREGDMVFQSPEITKCELAKDLDLARLEFTASQQQPRDPKEFDVPTFSPQHDDVNDFLDQMPMKLFGHRFVGHDSDDPKEQESVIAKPLVRMGRLVHKKPVQVQRRKPVTGELGTVDQLFGLTDGDTPLAMGFCGGPCMDLHGRLMGMVEGISADNSKRVAIIPVSTITSTEWEPVNVGEEVPPLGEE
jgi:hypothetical protein